MLDILNEIIILFFDWFEVIFGLVTGYILLRLFGISTPKQKPAPTPKPIEKPTEKPTQKTTPAPTPYYESMLFWSAYIALMIALVFWLIPYFYGNL